MISVLANWHTIGIEYIIDILNCPLMRVHKRPRIITQRTGQVTYKAYLGDFYFTFSIQRARAKKCNNNDRDYN